ncbi:MAG TPA: class I SAM-dependent methyltransferase [Bacteroidota bacterium]|nr:class I SAM-dependent methyltransferase [Bacteroidota bacterium]
MTNHVSSHNWLIYKVLDREVERAAKKFARGRLLDVGCGTKPYEELFAPFVSHHVGLDREETIHPKHHIELFGSILKIPCEDESFDTVLCTEVLEHVEEPGVAVGEMGRVLRKGGHCILTTPFFWHIHEPPRDFFRYSKYGLQYLFEKNGFTIVELRAIAGFWVTFSQELAYYLYKFKKSLLLRFPAHVLIWLVQSIGYVLDRLDKDEDFATEYIVVAQRV